MSWLTGFSRALMSWRCRRMASFTVESAAHKKDIYKIRKGAKWGNV
jgi:hypothetical protein